MTPFLPVNRGVPQGTVPGPVRFTLMVNDISPTSQNTLLTKYADDITCSIPVGPNINDNASEEVENLLKLNRSKTKELAIRGRTSLPPPEPIVTIKRVSYLKLLGVTFQDSPTNWDKHFDDLMERAVKRMHILRMCKRNGSSAFDLDDLLIASLCQFLLTVSEFGVLPLIPNTLVKLIVYWEGPFDLGILNMNHRLNRLLKTLKWGSGKVLWVLPRIPCRIFSPHLRTGLYAVGPILTRSHLLIQRGLRNAL